MTASDDSGSSLKSMPPAAAKQATTTSILKDFPRAKSPTRRTVHLSSLTGVVLSTPIRLEVRTELVLVSLVATRPVMASQESDQRFSESALVRTISESIRLATKLVGRPVLK